MPQVDRIQKQFHLLFSGDPGTGKTTLAKLLLHELEVDKGDILEINASSMKTPDVMREKITNFAQTMPFGDSKYVLLDEADYIHTKRSTIPTWTDGIPINQLVDFC